MLFSLCQSDLNIGEVKITKGYLEVAVGFWTIWGSWVQGALRHNRGGGEGDMAKEKKFKGSSRFKSVSLNRQAAKGITKQ